MLNKSYMLLVLVANHDIEMKKIFCSYLDFSWWFLAIGSENDSLLVQKWGTKYVYNQDWITKLYIFLHILLP